MTRNSRNVIWYSAFLLMALALMVFGLGGRAYAQGGPTPTLRAVSDDEVNKVARNLYCPVCQNVPLEVCETAACADWREQVRTLLAQGYTEDQVRQYFINRFGTKTVGMPPDTGSQILTVLLPFAVIAVIGIVIGVNLVVWRRNQRKEQTPTVDSMNEGEPGTVTQDDYRARLEAELKERN